jgi:transcription initiation factor IIE alpha subunit
MVELVCQRCGHDWDYQGQMDDYATCPGCKTSVALPESGTQQGSTTNETEFRDGIEDRLDRIEGKIDRLTEVVQREYYEETQEKTPETEVDKYDEDDGEDTSPYDPTEEF